ncbi:MAG: 2-C-methyl-D-erythritol 4-phosphate cytidylyltransferase [Treponema sp.]|nr:2-C-methyl-D-erythritol 4-phosphate cytidylyltransferase [Candidatus Treponema caballi]
MENIAIILAGGVGSRIGGPMPKQFLSLNDKPVIVHTLENFQKNKLITGIVIVCVKDWIPHLKQIIEEYKISKVNNIVEGGDTGHDSTRNGLFSLKGILSDNDFVIIHDAARPILPQAAIDNMLSVAHEKGNASLAIPCYETMIFTDDGKSGAQQLDRNCVMRIQTPQAYNFKEICSLYEKAEQEGKHDFVYADIVYIHYGKTVYFTKGFTNNIKITRKEDIPLCKALMSFTEEELYY